MPWLWFSVAAGADHIFAQANSKQSDNFRTLLEAISRSLTHTFAALLAGAGEPSEPCDRGMVSACSHLSLKPFSLQ
jgi:hypothetical protein